jgi:hypothetical protein
MRAKVKEVTKEWNGLFTIAMRVFAMKDFKFSQL